MNTFDRIGAEPADEAVQPAAFGRVGSPDERGTKIDRRARRLRPGATVRAMRDARFHLAQINVGRLLAPIDSAQIAGFVEQLEPINRLAEASPGYVWRLQSDGGNATDIQLTDDVLFIINLSVWESIETLRDFTYSTEHTTVLRQRRAWFERHVEPHFALWWIEAGTIPTPTEALERVERLRRFGPTAEAFTFRTPYPPPGSSEPLAPADIDAEFCWPNALAV